MSFLYSDAGPAPVNGRKVMLATTVYDSPDASYTFSIANSREALHTAGLPSFYVLVQGNCHVDDARNAVVRDFLRSDCSELVFLDADVSWEPEQLVELCRYDSDVVGGIYPYRRETGMEGMPVRSLEGVHEPDEDGLLEVEGLPTGFIRIKRHVLETLAKSAETFRKTDGVEIPLVFDRTIYNGGRMGGDINFCRKWREAGGRVFAASNLRLGHCGKYVIRDSLAAYLRRQTGDTLKFVCDAIRNGDETPDHYDEAVKLVNNPWGAHRSVLPCAVALARKAQGPIIEAGSGLSTILMAAASEHPVYALEHAQKHAIELEHMAAQAGVGSKIFLVTCPIKNRFYDVEADKDALPDKFAVGFLDGPPRQIGDRMRFFDEFGERCNAILMDDADDESFMRKVRVWTETHGRSLQESNGRAAVILPKEFASE